MISEGYEESKVPGKKKFEIVNDEGSFFDCWFLIDKEDNNRIYDVTHHPETVPPRVVYNWVEALNEQGKCSPVELRVALDLLAHYAKSYL